MGVFLSDGRLVAYRGLVPDCNGIGLAIEGNSFVGSVKRASLAYTERGRALDDVLIKLD